MGSSADDPSAGLAPDLDSLRRLPVGALAAQADWLRQEVMAAVGETGGHLGAGLGVVELTIALHYVYDTPHDRLIWDVGHQAYPHKILTGRAERIRTIRRPGGLSGFTKRDESPFDPFGAGHSSTSISAALGMATARDLSGFDRHVVCVIGDGALSAGMAYEALNNVAAAGRIVIVLNDNGMSIAPAVGGMAHYLPGLRGGEGGGTLFDDLGVRYLGPIDGHDVVALINALRLAREADRSVLLHVRTLKGQGHPGADASPERLHAISPPAKPTSVPVPPTYTSVFADALVREAKADRRIVAITAAMPSGTGLDIVARAVPERCFDVGIAEQHAVTFAAGLASEGMRPFCAIYSTFLQRGYDQVVHDVAVQNLPVRFAIDRAGLVGADGPTHAGSFDVAFLTALPNMVVMAPADEAELVHMVTTAASHDSGPIAVRFPRGNGTGVPLPERAEALPIGRGRILERGADIALLSLGTRLGACREAGRRLRERGLSVTIADARFAKPIDRALLMELAAGHRALLTVEEGAAGGFGAHVMAALTEEDAFAGGLRFRTLTLPDRFIEHGDVAAMLASCGLDAGGIAATATAMLRERVSRPEARRARP